jgi:hypothetical protein
MSDWRNADWKRYLEMRKWKYVEPEGLWHDPEDGDYYTPSGAVTHQLFSDDNVAIDAMLRLPELTARVAALEAKQARIVELINAIAIVLVVILIIVCLM